jgi:predicted amidohydrolase
VLLAQSGIDAFLVVAGGPTELGEGVQPGGTQRWQWIAGAVAVTCVTPVFFANRCGWEEGILFAGGSWAVDARGRSLAEPAPALDEAVVYAVLSPKSTALTPILNAERRELWHDHPGARRG